LVIYDWLLQYQYLGYFSGNINAGWWFQPTLLKNMKFKWDGDIPNIWKNNPNVPNHQPE